MVPGAIRMNFPKYSTPVQGNRKNISFQFNALALGNFGVHPYRMV
jgi:hypothetical protein